MKSLLKTLNMALLISLTASANLTAEELKGKRLKNVKRDLNIMTTIISTAIGDKGQHNRSVDGIYLANQGMVFTIKSGRNYRFSFSDSHHMDVPVAPTAPVPPIAAMLSNAPMSEEDIAQLEESTMAAVEMAMDLAEVQMDFHSERDWSDHSTRERAESRAQQKELQNQRRELERESRKLERSVHEIERKIRDAEYQQELNSTAETKQRITSLEQEMNQLTASLGGVAKQLNDKAEALKSKAQEMREKQVAQQNAHIEATEQAFSLAICDFGAGLRTLTKGEHITLNLKGNNDRLYVFDLPNISKCADGDITATELLNQAIQYTL